MKEQIHNELASLQSELSRLNSAVKHIEDAKQLAKNITENGQELQAKYKEQLQEVKELTTKYQELVGRAERLIDKIDKVDFPIRLDKLDNAVTAINQGVQNTQGKLENIGRDLKDEIKELKANLTAKIEGNRREVKILKILLIISLALSIGILIFEIIK
jgi:chromosome segregation ATPase